MIRRHDRYVETACGDGNKASDEIGVDCGLDACGVKCTWNDDNKGGKSKKGEICDVNDDCAGDGNLACFSGKCKLSYFSCRDVDAKLDNAPDGLYTINVDKHVTTFEKDPESTGTTEVYCMRYERAYSRD